MAIPNKFNNIPKGATLSDDRLSFTINWHGEELTYVFDETDEVWKLMTTNDGSEGSTIAANIASNPSVGFSKKKKLKEDEDVDGFSLLKELNDKVN